MKVTIEFPELTACATVSFVYVGEDGGYKMCSSLIDTDVLKEGYLKVPRSEDSE